MMNKAEIRNLLNRREELCNVYQKLENDADSYNDMKLMFNSTCNNIYDTIVEIDSKLKTYVLLTPVGEWLLQIKGITPELAAGLLVHFDVKGKECAAQFIKYAGTDNYNNPHNNKIRAIMDKVTDSLKANNGLYAKLNEQKFVELFSGNLAIGIHTAHIRADRYMKKVFISHLFEEMYREEYGKLPNRHDNTDRLIIEPEVPYTKEGKCYG